MKILMVITSHDQLGNTGRKTGFWLEELAAPYFVFKDSGAEITLAPEQIFYFDENALQRRTDHDLFGMKVAHHSWAHDSFGGIVVPTLRRAQALQPDGTVVAKPVLMDVEIFDAVFE